MIIISLTERKKTAYELRGFLIKNIPECESVICIGVNELEAYIEETRTATFIFSTWNMASLSRDEIQRFFPNLKAIFYVGGDTTYFAGPFTELGIEIFDARNENSRPVSEFVVAQILLANKGYFQACRKYTRLPNYFGFHKARKISRRHHGNFRSTIGLIGLGNVGLQVLKILRQFDVRIMACDPKLSTHWAAENGIEKSTLEEIFAQANVVSNHLPDAPGTRNLLDYHCFSLMPANSCFINAGRGNQVVEKDLARALREDTSRAALLDVTAHEPLFPFSAFARLPNVFLTPHIAGSQANEIDRMCLSLIERAAEHGYL